MNSSNIAELVSSKSGLSEQQEALQNDLHQLESDGRTARNDNYQSIVTDIANDIRLHERRQRERAEQKKSIAQTRRKLVEQREELKDKMLRYEEYLETCLQNLSRTSRRLSFRPNTKEAGKIQKERASLDQIKSYKSSADKLVRKGVIVHVAAYETPKKIGKLSVEVASTEERGVFSITLIESGKVVDTITLYFQDLLKALSVDEKTCELDSKVVLDVAKTIQYINKKFYNK
uniref:RasGAP_C domain-containing protein n=1 Tax=Caenorhabditis japonica TaxID=281687 RepID=A0A8R1HQS7_CAEJA